jgi:hypothetical protein
VILPQSKTCFTKDYKTPSLQAAQQPRKREAPFIPSKTSYQIPK